MLDPSFIFKIKNEYGSIFETSIKKQVILFRELTFSEFDLIAEFQKNGNSTAADIEDLIIKFAVIHPENFNADDYPAGLVSSLAEEVLEESGFSSAKRAKQIVEQKRQEAGEVRALMKAFVLSTMSSFKPSDLDNMTFSKLAEYVALSEKVIEIQQNIAGMESSNVSLQLIDPEEEIQKQKDFANRFNSSRKEGEAKFEDPIARKLWGSG
jgi:hypothetical protein